MDFKTLELDDKPLIDSLLSQEYITSSELIFTTFYIWRRLLHAEFAVSDGCVIYKTKHGGNPHAYRYPLGGGDKRAALEKMISAEGRSLRIYGMTENMVNELNALYPGEFEISATDDYSDYVYTSERLINLSGKKLHSKRNHINSFYKQYNSEYTALSAKYADFICNGYDSWYKETDDEYLIEEKVSVCEIMRHFDTLGLVGGMITVNGSLAAFAIGERLNTDTAVVHIEKADTAYDGAYSVINRELAANALVGYKYINREEDMGLLGLRKAKQSYLPEMMVKKYKGVYCK